LTHDENAAAESDDGTISRRMGQVSMSETNPSECISPYYSSQEMNQAGKESFRRTSNDDHDNAEIGEHRKNLEDLIIQLESEDASKLTPFYSGGSMSVHEACVRLVRLAVSLKIDKHGMHKLLKQLRQFFPSDCRLPKTVCRLIKMTDGDNRVEVSVNFTFFQS
jgi:hypothetical protein